MKKLLIILALAVAACQSQKPTETVVVEPEPEVETEFVCTNDNDEPLECNFDSDCCEGFVCVKDDTYGHHGKSCVSE